MGRLFYLADNLLYLKIKKCVEIECFLCPYGLRDRSLDSIFLWIPDRENHELLLKRGRHKIKFYNVYATPNLLSIQEVKVHILLIP
jgi:hypothetical protein